MRKLFLIFCSAVVLSTALAVTVLSDTRDDSLYATLSRDV